MSNESVDVGSFLEEINLELEDWEIDPSILHSYLLDENLDKETAIKYKKVIDMLEPKDQPSLSKEQNALSSEAFDALAERYDGSEDPRSLYGDKLEDSSIEPKKVLKAYEDHPYKKEISSWIKQYHRLGKGDIPSRRFFLYTIGKETGLNEEETKFLLENKHKPASKKLKENLQRGFKSTTSLIKENPLEFTLLGAPLISLGFANYANFLNQYGIVSEASKIQTALSASSFSTSLLTTATILASSYVAYKATKAIVKSASRTAAPRIHNPKLRALAVKIGFGKDAKVNNMDFTAKKRHFENFKKSFIEDQQQQVKRFFKPARHPAVLAGICVASAAFPLPSLVLGGTLGTAMVYDRYIAPRAAYNKIVKQSLQKTNKAPEKQLETKQVIKNNLSAKLQKQNKSALKKVKAEKSKQLSQGKGLKK